jgi:hypothetical protein
MMRMMIRMSPSDMIYLQLQHRSCVVNREYERGRKNHQIATAGCAFVAGKSSTMSGARHNKLDGNAVVLSDDPANVGVAIQMRLNRPWR